MVGDALSRRPTGQPFGSETALICDDSHFLSKLRSYYALDTHATAAFDKFNNGRRVKRYSLNDGLLWFATRRGLRRFTFRLRSPLKFCENRTIMSFRGMVGRTIPWRESPGRSGGLTCAPQPDLLQRLPIPERIWTDLSMDFMVGLSKVRGCDSVYVVVDRLSKYAYFIVCSSSITAEGVARLFLTHVWKLQGFPRSIITGRDPKSVSSFWRAFMARLKIDNNMTSANHPVADGQTECINRTLIQCLQLFTHENPSERLDFLPCAESVYNKTVYSSTRCSPASLVYTETPFSDPVVGLAVGSQPCLGPGKDPWNI